VNATHRRSIVTGNGSLAARQGRRPLTQHQPSGELVGEFPDQAGFYR
jgi:hypothetical protein